MSFQYASNVYWHYIHNYSETSQKACNISLLGKKKWYVEIQWRKNTSMLIKKKNIQNLTIIYGKKKFWYLHADKNVGSNI